MKRRFVLLGGAVAALSAVGVPGFRRLSILKENARFRSACKATLATQFSPAVMAHPATDEFLDAYLLFARTHPMEVGVDLAVEDFILGSNVIAHLERGEDLWFNAVFRPQITPCTNMLSAVNAPAGEHD